MRRVGSMQKSLTLILHKFQIYIYIYIYIYRSSQINFAVWRCLVATQKNSPRMHDEKVVFLVLMHSLQQKERWSVLTCLDVITCFIRHTQIARQFMYEIEHRIMYVMRVHVRPNTWHSPSSNIASLQTHNEPKTLSHVCTHAFTSYVPFTWASAYMRMSPSRSVCSVRLIK